MKHDLKIKHFNDTAVAPEIFNAPAKVAQPSAARTSSPAGTADIYTIYLREIGTVPMLAPGEERELVLRARAGDEEARQRMITANLRLVVRIARDHEGYGLALLDMINEGNLGLMTAVDRYDPDKGAKLSTFAALYIKTYIRRAIANYGRTVRLPVHLVERIPALYAVTHRLRQELGREPTDEEIGEQLKLPARTVNRIRELGGRETSLNELLGDDSEKTLESIIADVAAENPADAFEEQAERELLAEALGSLSPREQHVLSCRFGLGDAPEQTLDEVSAIFKLTRERIRQIQNEALAKLRRRLKEREAMESLMSGANN